MRRGGPIKYSNTVYVDLDGTLVRTDTLVESILKYCRINPLKLVLCIYWLANGKAILKDRLAKKVTLDPAHLPYNRQVLDYLETQKFAGKSLVLATGAHQTIANSIAQYLGLFEGVIASSKSQNVTGKDKLESIKKLENGCEGFHYIGNSKEDVVIWQSSGGVVAVNSSQKTLNQIKAFSQEATILRSEKRAFFSFIRSMRPHQWSKNLLVFVPIIFAQAVLNVDSWLLSIAAFVAFSLCASSMYIFNDIVDIDNDRRHPIKKNRPFACGDLSIVSGVVLASFLLIAAISLAIAVNLQFLLVVGLYSFITTLYTHALKRMAIVDVTTLGALYTLRVIAGGAATGTLISEWMLAFSMFFFFSLAIGKRCNELSDPGNEVFLNGENGRGYKPVDLTTLRSIGVGSGLASILVLFLYLNSEKVRTLYLSPDLLWGAALLMLVWINRVWLMIGRGAMHHDPVIFALKDRFSYVTGVAILVILVLANLVE